MNSYMAFLLFPAAAMASDAVIEKAEAQRSVDVWSFSVTLSHADTGWNDYADGWRVVLEDGTELGMRVLMHPHVNEQPFTRALGGVSLPDGTSEVFIEARTLVDGWGAQRLAVPIK